MSRRRRLTRREKEELFGKQKEDVAISCWVDESEEVLEAYDRVFSPIPPEDLGIEDKKIIKRIVIHKEEDAWDDNFIPPAQYYFVNALGHHIYVRTNRRNTAQEICDTLYGKNFYRVKRVLRAVVS